MKQGKKLYYPFNSQNFNAIFASESISPPRFYPKRNFGHNRFEPLSKYLDSGLILFEQFPYFVTDPNSDIEAYVLIFEFTNLAEGNLTEIGQGIWRYDATIYLNQDNFRLYFPKPYVKKVMLSEAKTSKTTKTVVKYESQFDDTEILKVSLKKYDLSKINIEEKSFDKKVAIDRFFNSFKGFIYGYLAGEIGKKSSIEIEFSKSVQNIINCFAQYKNELADNSNTSKYQTSSKSYPKSTPNINKSKSVEFELNEAIRISKQLFSNLGKDKFEPVSWITNHLDISQENEGVVKKVLSFMSRLFFDYDKVIKREYAKNSNSPSLLFEIVEDSIYQYKSAGVELRQRLDDEIKDNLFAIEKYIKSKSLERAGSKEVSDFSHIELFVKNEEIGIAKTKLTEKDTINFVKICNVLLKERKDFNGKTNDEDLLIIVEKVWDSFGLHHKRTDNVIHKYLSHKSKSIELETQSEVTQNFVAFLLNPNNIEILKTYIEDKKIQNSWIAYSFWGLYNGFANIGRDFTNVILSTENYELMQSIDSYLDKVLQKIEVEYEYKKPVFIAPKPEPMKKFETIVVSEQKKQQNTEGVSPINVVEFDLTIESIGKVLKSLDKKKGDKIQGMIDKIEEDFGDKFGIEHKAKKLQEAIEKSNNKVRIEANKITYAEIDKIKNAYKATKKNKF